MSRRRGAVFVVLGCAILGLAAWGLWRDIGWIAQPFYAYAWWGYILVLDGFCALRRGHSLLTTRWRLVVPMAVGSVTFWFFFELLNVRFQNWYYVGVPRIESLGDLVRGGVFAVVCFSTVFIGIFETIEALAAAGLGRTWRGRPRALPAWVSYAVQALGAAMALAAICFPYYLSPLIWGSLTFLVDPWNYRRRHRSILRDVEARDWGLVARVFVAGLICGVVWESMNFFAPQKWIYTVRGLEGAKLFEMPLLGFLGFPGLAYDCMAGFALLSALFLGNQTWEHPGDLRYALPPKPRPRARVFWASVPVQVLFWAGVCVLSAGVSFGSLQLRMQDLHLSARECARLADLGIGRPRQLVRAVRDSETRAAVKERTGWSDPHIEDLVDRVELFTFKGIGASNGEALRLIGVRRVEDLAEWEPEHLYRVLMERARSLTRRSLRVDMVRVWVLASRDRGILIGGQARRYGGRQ